MIVKQWHMTSDELNLLKQSEESVKDAKSILVIDYPKYKRYKYITCNSSKKYVNENIKRLLKYKYTVDEIIQSECYNIKHNIFNAHILGAPILQYEHNKKYINRYKTVFNILNKYNNLKFNIYYKEVSSDIENDRICYSLFYINNRIYIYFSYFYSHSEENGKKSFLTEDELKNAILETTEFYRILIKRYGGNVLYEKFDDISNF